MTPDTVQSGPASKVPAQRTFATNAKLIYHFSFSPCDPGEQRAQAENGISVGRKKMIPFRPSLTPSSTTNTNCLPLYTKNPTDPNLPGVTARLGPRLDAESHARRMLLAGLAKQDNCQAKKSSAEQEERSRFRR